MPVRATRTPSRMPCGISWRTRCATRPRGTEIVVVLDALGAVEVRDKGPGIPDAEKSLAVQRFWRGPHSGGGGTGLGLSIARRIMEAHRGELRIGDQPGGEERSSASAF